MFTSDYITFMLLTGSILLLWMHVGFMLVEFGYGKPKHLGNAIIKHILIVSVSTLAFLFVGYGFMFGTDLYDGLIGTPNFGFWIINRKTENIQFFILFQVMLATLTPAIMSGVIGNRMKLQAILLYSFVASALIFPIVGHWSWGGGWLSHLPVAFHDFGGASIIHITGGCLGLIASLLLGPRLGRYRIGKVPLKVENRVSYTLSGLFFIVSAWLGLLSGVGFSLDGISNVSFYHHILFASIISAVMSSVSALILSYILNKKIRRTLGIKGAIAGLVSISAGCDVVSLWSAAIIGLITGIVVTLSIDLFKKKLHVDDKIGAISVHAVSGILGVLLTGFFSGKTGLLFGFGSAQLISQSIGVVCTLSWALIIGLFSLEMIKLYTGLRLSAKDELKDVDSSLRDS